jgi:subtilisin family serine protease
MKILKNKPVKSVMATLVVLMGIVLSFTFMSCDFSPESAKDDGHKAIINEVSVEKVYSRATMDDDFDGQSVIVVLDRNISGINKRHDAGFFGEIGIAEIEDLTVVTDEKTVVDEKNWEQVVLLTLSKDSKENVLRVISQLERIDGIKYAGANRYIEVELNATDPLYTNAVAERGQWGLDKIQAPLAWDFTTGSRNVRVGIIDTGIANHPDLNANLDNGWDFINITPTRGNIDIDSHGTHVAGIAGAVGNSIGIAGVNWNVTLVQMRVGTTGFNRAAVVRAINWVKDNWNNANRVSILSYSSGIYEARPDYETAIRGYSNVGGLFVCSTGNVNQDNDVRHHYPSFYASAWHTNPIANMIAVGRSDINDARPTVNYLTGMPVNANWGARTITLFAPGQNILSTVPVAM